MLHLHFIKKHCWIIYVYNTTGIKCTMGRISPLKVWVYFSPASRSTRYSPLSINYDRSLVFCTTNKTDCNNITEILLKVVLNIQPRCWCVHHEEILFDLTFFCAFCLSLCVFFSLLFYVSLLYVVWWLCFR